MRVNSRDESYFGYHHGKRVIDGRFSPCGQTRKEGTTQTEHYR